MIPIPRNLLKVSISGLLATLCGAFGSHSLKAHLLPNLYPVWQTAVEFQYYHTLALFLASFLPIRQSQFLRPDFWFLLGIIFFSGSLYALVLLSLINIHWVWLGVFTPLGGAFFILGWLFLALGARKDNGN